MTDEVIRVTSSAMNARAWLGEPQFLIRLVEAGGIGAARLFQALAEPFFHVTERGRLRAYGNGSVCSFLMFPPNVTT